ncbi:hypothetical protein DPMN_086866 [Dreissena polymorpha]|uniref:Uncharacterized protein n=1 Tax=Dreissena polymorpha TaxID=45954 RepID=A0A9D4QVV4_DREPO|nr:hypothetical protein DPMN_086866 [Dreissena polymorpha]
MATQRAHLEGIMPIEEGFQTGLQRFRAVALITRLPQIREGVEVSRIWSVSSVGG